MTENRTRPGEGAGSKTVGRNEGPPPSVGASLLDDVHRFVGRFVAYPSRHAQIAHTLWVAHCWLMDAWDSTPRIAFLSPEPGSGKTRALEVTELLVPRAVEAVNTSPAYLFRRVSDPGGLPTILYDEIDTVFGPRARENEEIRGLLNAGHRRGAVAGRCVVRGKEVFTEELPAYCAVALAGLGGLPDTLLSRSIVVRMRRRSRVERIEPFRRRLVKAEGEDLARRLADWAAIVESEVRDAWPTMPPGIEDRDADLWEAPLAIADAAGGHWPRTARVAAVTHVTASKESSPSLGVRLLGDIWAVFADRDAMATVDLLDALHALDEAPWVDLRGKPLDPRGLANLLRPYEIGSTTVRVGDWHGKGFRRDDFFDAWCRYLPSPPIAPVTSVTTVTEAVSETSGDTNVTDVTDPREANLQGGSHRPPTSIDEAEANLRQVFGDVTVEEPW